jgi:hypothetical protein
MGNDRVFYNGALQEYAYLLPIVSVLTINAVITTCMKPFWQPDFTGKGRIIIM